MDTTAATDSLTDMLTWLEGNSGKIIFFVAVFVVAWVVVKGISKLLRKVLDRTDMPNASIFVNIVRVLIWVCAATVVLKPVFGIDPTTLMTALGVGGIAVSLGLKDTVANIVSGFGLMFGKVIQPGDLITVAGTTGVVKDITWRQTVVLERNGNEMVIPNSVLNTASLEKLAPSNESMVTVPFTAKAGEDTAAIERRIVTAVSAGTAGVAVDGTTPLVKFTGFSPYGIEGQVLVFAKSGVLLSTARDAAVRALADADFIEQRAAIGA
ncbi:mechanosensitive ion channel family protein [Bifidobacterium biavatii]|uniref:Small-conductance mechanosensitive channel n=1 Tax=Bifidobacterium biavatii DSM 23969 TaxID=1437608 RepID=A0A086ZSE3_9BIFI|nr:mechanosensitive ion channel domain-containing protein [Bifidobacterium biavatii]KFI49443.1 Small-conductance mechanosensitive channel [Bifidobacterium biavatii DSM 23969]